MKTAKLPFGFLATLIFMLILSSEAFAQYGYGRRHGGYYSYRPRVSVNIGINPYYRYAPVYRPRVYYHPSYRRSYPYVHYGPAFGLRINMLPFGYSPFFISGNTFYYYNGIYYRPYSGGGYEVTQPPLGAEVKHLPSGAKATVINGQKYYELGGTFYQEKFSTKNKVRYEVVGTDGVLNTTRTDADDNEKETTQGPSVPDINTVPAEVEGAVVSSLPAGSTSVIISQQKYYLSPAGVYYEEMIDGNNKVIYKAVGSGAPVTKTGEASPDMQ